MILVVRDHAVCSGRTSVAVNKVLSIVCICSIVYYCCCSKVLLSVGPLLSKVHHSNDAVFFAAVQVGVFRLLVEKHGAQLDTLTANKSGLLHVACEAGALDVAKLLLEEHG